MISGIWLWVTFVLIALATHIPRGSFIVAGSRARLPSALQRALRYAPAAALSALVLPDVVLDGGELDPLNPKLAAALAVLLMTALRPRNPWLPFIVGMGVLLLLRKGLGW